MELKLVPVAIPENANVIIGQSHFIKTVEDLYEIMVTSVPGATFGLAFNEASGAAWSGPREMTTACGRRPSTPRWRSGPGTPSCCTSQCLPDQRLEPNQGLPRGLPDLLRDGQSATGGGGRVRPGARHPRRHRRRGPKGVEQAADREWRVGFLRKIGYKR